MALEGRYEVKLDLFEGPLDLLLYLVTKAEVDITEIPVAQIAQQYLEYLDLMRELNIDVASEYLHMAATLVRLKARELLPPSEAEALVEAEQGVYNKEQLIQQLLEYKKYKEAAYSLRKLEHQQAGSFSRGKPEEIEVESADEPLVLGNLSIYDLLSAFWRLARPSPPATSCAPIRSVSTTVSTTYSPCWATARSRSSTCSSTTREGSFWW
jgi:segregation and condensation protein A